MAEFSQLGLLRIERETRVDRTAADHRKFVAAVRTLLARRL
jgi:hypothetical protein